MEQAPLWQDTVYLVSCCKEKAYTYQTGSGWERSTALNPELQARDLYVSDWFLKARAFVEATGCEWHILSALCGLVHPERMMLSYEFTFDPAHDDNDRIRRQTWSQTVTTCLAMRHRPKMTHVAILAGALYREFLIPALEQAGFTVSVPMIGLGIGQQKRWLMERKKQ